MISKCERCDSLSISEGPVVPFCSNSECGIDGMQMADGFLSFYMTDGAIVRWDSEKHGKFIFSSPSCRKIWTGMIKQAWVDVEFGWTRWIDLGFDRYVRSMNPEEAGGLEWYTNTHYHATRDREDAAKRFSKFGLWGLPYIGPRSCPSSDMIGIYCVKSKLSNIHN